MKEYRETNGIEFLDKVNQQKATAILDCLKNFSSKEIGKLPSSITMVMDGLKLNHPFDIINIAIAFPNSNCHKIIQDDSSYGAVSIINFSMDGAMHDIGKHIFNECSNLMFDYLFENNKYNKFLTIEKQKELAINNLKILALHLFNNTEGTIQNDLRN